MSLKRDDSLVSEFERLKSERQRLVKEIGTTPHSKSHLLESKIARVKAIESRMRELKSLSAIKLV